MHINYDAITDVMLDVETMSTRPDAAIVSIAASFFNEDSFGPQAYMAVSLKSSMDAGGVVDADTMLWWMQQTQEAQSAWADPIVQKNTYSEARALEQLRSFLK